MVAIIGAITFSVVIILSVDFSNILCNSYFTDGGFFPVLVFKKSNQDNLHSYGCIPFVEYGHEFCVKE